LTGYNTAPKGLTIWDAERYGTLSIPDDALSYDIFTQVGRIFKKATHFEGPSPLGDLTARKLIGLGGSQSGTRILAYINGIQPRENVYDALMPVICGAFSIDFLPEPVYTELPSMTSSQRNFQTRVRDDLAVPVFALNTEFESLFYAPFRQPDSDKFRNWEIAGSSHLPAHLAELIDAIAQRDGVYLETPAPPKPSSGVEWLPTLHAAIVQTNEWIASGTQPTRHQPVSVHESTFSRDVHGNVLGGVRLPELEVPVATYLAWFEANLKGGATTPFDPAKIKELYPTREEYVEKVRRAAAVAEKEGVILPGRAREYELQTGQAEFW